MRNLIFFAIAFQFVATFSWANSQVGTLKTGNNSSVGNAKTDTLFVRDILQIRQDSKTKAIYSIGKKDGITEIAVANAINNKWEIQKYAVPNSAIEKSDLSKYLDKSIELNDWVEIQN